MKPDNAGVLRLGIKEINIFENMIIYLIYSQTVESLNQKLWEWSLAIWVRTNPLGNVDVCSIWEPLSLRTTQWHGVWGPSEQLFSTRGSFASWGHWQHLKTFFVVKTGMDRECYRQLMCRVQGCWYTFCTVQDSSPQAFVLKCQQCWGWEKHWSRTIFNLNTHSYHLGSFKILASRLSFQRF